jgi:hypothetical protein
MDMFSMIFSSVRHFQPNGMSIKCSIYRVFPNHAKKVPLCEERHLLPIPA